MRKYVLRSGPFFFPAGLLTAVGKLPGTSEAGWPRSRAGWHGTRLVLSREAL